MTAKRALIVDDSKSARVVLSRLLEKHDLTVDTTESAEGALNYLREHRPDVIFMDHVMSGMDGLTAMQQIKSDPTTASIPIMMYTSQDGELYADEARALGATGVLPKLMAPADIAALLYKLQLLPERNASASGTFDRVQLPAVDAASGPVAGVIVAAPASAPAPPGLTPADVRGVVEPLLTEQGADLRRFVVASLESFSARVVTDLAAQVQAAVASATAVVPQPAPIVSEPLDRAAPPAPAAGPRPLGWIALAALGCAAALAVGIVAWQQHRELAALDQRLDAQGRDLAAARAAVEAARAVPAALTIAPASGAAPLAVAAPVAAAPAPQRLAVPYGEVALSGPRLAALAALLADLEKRGVAGTVRVTTAVGDYCLTGNPGEGYSLAPGEMPANRCDVVGNPFEEALRPADREPAALGALIAGTAERTHGALAVAVVHAGRLQTPNAYPAAADVSAAQWNAAAASHSYVEVAVEPRSAAP